MTQSTNYEVSQYTEYLGMLAEQLEGVYLEMNQKLEGLWDEAKKAFEEEVNVLMSDCQAKVQEYEEIEKKNMECQELLRNASNLISQISMN